VTSIPSIPTLLYFITSIALSGGSIFLAYRTGTTTDIVSKIFVLILIGSFLLFAYLIITRFKVLKISNDKITLIYPLLFKARQITADEITKFNWSIKDMYKFGSFKELRIEVNDKYWDSIGEIEFENFEKLEKTLISKIKFEPDIIQKRENEITHARNSRGRAVFFLIVWLIACAFGVTRTIALRQPPILLIVITGICLILSIRLILKVIKYYDTLKEYDRARARRKK
jgi:hypothetical protein